jgi:hypothetical protein
MSQNSNPSLPAVSAPTLPRQWVVCLSGASENDAISGIVQRFATMFRAHGYKVLHIDGTDQEQVTHLLACLQNDQLAFAFSYLGIYADLSFRSHANAPAVNAWEQFNVPFLSWHGDMPAYAPIRHSDVCATAVHIYPSLEFLRMRQRWWPQAATPAVMQRPFAMAVVVDANADAFEKEKGKIIFTKNGGDPKALRQQVLRQLPASLANHIQAFWEHVWPIAKAREAVYWMDEASAFCESNQMPTSPELLRLMCSLADDWTRRMKSTLIATALLDLPVVIQGARWEHLRQHNVKAELRPGQTFAQTNDSFAKALAVVDMSPNIAHGCHERVLRCAGLNTLVLSNRTPWLATEFPDLNAAGFDFEVESIRQSVETVRARPADAVALGREFGHQFAQKFSDSSFVAHVSAQAEAVRFLRQAQKPTIQPFYFW